MSDPYRVRPVKREDLPRVAPLWRRLVEFEASLSPRFAVKSDAEKLWVGELEADKEAARAEVFLVEEVEAVTPSGVGPRIVGFMHVRATRGAPFHSEDRLGFVDGVWIEPDHRKRGLSKRLLAEVEAWCRQRRLTLIEAGVVTANKDAVAAWEKLGFRMTSATMTRDVGRDPRKGVAAAFDAQAPRVASSPYFTFEKRVRRLVEFAMPHPTHRLLEVGCGPGVVLAAIRDRVGGRVGVEISREMAIRARASGAEIVLAAAEHLPFKPASFQRVVTRSTLHHLREPAQGFGEMGRVLASGGALVVEDLVVSEDAAKAKRQNEIEALRDPSHSRMLSASEMKSHAAGAGLAVEDSLVVREPRELEAWLAISAPPPDRAERVREMARGFAQQAEKDESGLLFRVVGQEVRFDHTHFLVRARKPPAKPGSTRER